VWWVRVDGIRRPALILTRGVAIPLLTSVTIVPTTTHIRAIPTEVLLDGGDGMPQRCALTLDNVRTVSKRDIHRRITTLSGARLDEVCEKLSYALGC
jgi:mRNA interferase MazF